MQDKSAICPSEAEANAVELFAGPGEVRSIARSLDWSQSPLGPTSGWTPALRTMSRSIFESPDPICLWCGPQFALIYNDAYRRILGAKHPAALGQPGSVAWAEIWAELQPQFEGVRERGECVHFDDAPFTMARLEGGRTETAYFNYSLSPLREDDGSVAAVFNITPETTARVVVEQRLANEQSALALSEERLRLAVENADVGLWDVDVVHDQLTWSDRTKALFGISADVPVTMDDFYSGLHPSDREVTTAAFLAAADPENRAIYDVEYRTIGKEDGVERWVAAKGRGMFNASGHCLRVTGTALEISARKAAEIRRSAVADLTQAIRDLKDPVEIAYAAAEVLGRALGSSRVGYAAIDHDAETLHTDRDWTAPGVVTIAGTLPLRNYGSFIDSLKQGELIVIDDVRVDPRTEGPAAAALEAKSTRSFVNVPVLEQGRLVAVFFVNDGKKRSWGESDITLITEFADRTRTTVERARGEHALRQSEARLRALNETLEAQVEARLAERDRLWNLSQDMLARADYSGMMSAVSPAWTQVLGWSGHTLLTRGYATFMHPDDESSTLQAIAGMAKTGRPARFENRISTSDGNWKHIEWTVAPEPDGLNFIAVGRDLSLNKARDAELEKTQDALRQAQKMDMIGQLTGGVAHDFNNLLMAVIANLDLLKRHVADNPRTARLIEGAIQGANRGASLTQRLLAFARRQDLALAPTDISDLVKGLDDLLTKSVGPAVELHYELRSDLPSALVDGNQVELALLNLVVNARDAMPDGGSIVIATEAVTLAGDETLPDGIYVALTVSDDGMGMNEETLAKATEPFFSTKELGKGTGLGLSMIHGLAIQLKGALRLTSKLGQGTKAELLMPKTDMTALASAPLEEPAPRAYGSRRTILVVDDDALIAMSTVDMVEDLGHVVIEANSGKEALEHIYSGQHIDLMITDFSMPQMNGGQLALAARTARPALPILLATGYADLPPGAEIDLPRLSKPYTQEQLEREIAKLID